MRCAILELEATLETFPVWFIFGGHLPQTRGVFSTVLLKSVAVCLYAERTGMLERIRGSTRPEPRGLGACSACIIVLSRES